MLVSFDDDSMEVDDPGTPHVQISNEVLQATAARREEERAQRHQNGNIPPIEKCQTGAP